MIRDQDSVNLKKITMVQPLIEDRFWGYTRKQWVIFSVLALVNLLAGLVFSIQAPFYPKEVSSKLANIS